MLHQEGRAGKEMELPHGSFYVILECDVSRLSGIVHANAHCSFCYCLLCLLALSLVLPWRTVNTRRSVGVPCPGREGDRIRRRFVCLYVRMRGYLSGRDVIGIERRIRINVEIVVGRADRRRPSR